MGFFSRLFGNQIRMEDVPQQEKNVCTTDPHDTSAPQCAQQKTESSPFLADTPSCECRTDDHS